MIHLPGLLVACAAFWFVQSGETSWQMLALAGASIAAALAMAGMLRTADREGSPYLRAPQLIVYFAWLGVEIVKANIAVIRAVLDPRHTISPALVRVPMSARSGAARALFANSITLTPGTVTVDVADDSLLVHALHDAAAQPGDFATMDRLSRRAIDGGPGKSGS